MDIVNLKLSEIKPYEIEGSQKVGHERSSVYRSEGPDGRAGKGL